MVFRMGTRRQDLQILKSIVCLVFVFVVDYLLRQQLSTERGFHDLAMLVDEGHRHTIGLDNEVPIAEVLVDVRSVLFQHVAVIARALPSSYKAKVAPPEGIEPPTARLEGRCSPAELRGHGDADETRTRNSRFAVRWLHPEDRVIERSTSSGREVFLPIDVLPTEHST